MESLYILIPLSLALVGFIVWILHFVIHYSEIKIHLSSEFWFKRDRLQLDYEITPKLDMIEKKVEIEILIANTEGDLSPNKSEALTKLKEKFLNF